MAAAPEFWIDPAATKTACDISAFLVKLAASKPQDDNAAMVYRWAADLDPTNAAAFSGIGRVALKAGSLPDAIEWFSAAFLISPDSAPAALCVNLAIAYARSGDTVQALQWCAQAILKDRTFQLAYLQQFAVYEQMRDYESAGQILAEGLKHHPDDHQLLFARGTLRLAAGDYENGWVDYEHRPTKLQLAAAMDEYPEWDGSPLNGRTILVAREQGIGDEMQFSRYLPLLRELGGNIVVYTYPAMARLFADAYPFAQMISHDLDIPEFDCWVAMGSLPKLMSLVLTNAPRVGELPAWPFTRPHMGAPRYFSGRYLDGVGMSTAPISGAGFRVGLCWKGNREHQRDEFRSMPFDALRPLLDTPGCDFFSLQYGEHESGLVNLPSYCHDIADVAAAIAQLDLVITVDTMVAHLAGAMGKPVWVLLGGWPDWRWGRESDSTPWYPSAQIIRAQQPKRWGDAVQFASGKLRAILKDRTGTSKGDSVTTRRTTADSSSRNVNAEGLADRDAASPIITRNCRYGQMSWYANDTYIGRSLDLYAEYSEGEVDLFRRILKPGDVVVEAGANIGALTVPLAQIVGLDGCVWAFEPQPEYFSLLSQNIVRNVSGTKRTRLALGATAGTISLPIIPMDRVHAPGWTGSGDAHVVEQDRLDVYDQFPAFTLDRLDLLKIDVDGAEHDILKGAEQTIARCRPFIYLEYDKPAMYPDMLPWLADHDYRLYRHNPRLFNPQNFAGNPVNVFGAIVSAMILAVPNENKMRFPDLERIRIERTAN